MSDDKAIILNCVDLVVKQTILTCFNAFPTRIHVLSHLFLSNGNGYQWVKGDDGLYSPKCWERDEEPATSIPLKEEDKMFSSAPGIVAAHAFDNLIRQWVNDNIDLYCTRKYTFSTIDLRPKTLRHVYSHYNLFDEMPPVDELVPEWKAAIEEVCDYFLGVLNPHGMVKGSRKALDYLRTTDREASKIYLILMRAYEKVHVPFKNLPSRLNRELIGPTLEERYVELGLEGVMEYDEFLLVREMQCEEYHYSLKEYVEGYLETRARYFPNGVAGKANEQFSIDVMQSLSRYAGWNYFSVRDLAYTVERQLNTFCAFTHRIELEVEGNIGLAVGAG
jgi:hypothetical protein